MSLCTSNPRHLQCTCRICLRTYCALQLGATTIHCTRKFCLSCAVIQLEITRRNINAMLPFEILARIFWFCLPHHTSADFHEQNKKEMVKHTAPLLLGAVCSSWRDIAWKTPILWTSVVVYLFPNLKRSRFHNVMIDDWFSRTGDLPLYLCIYCYGRYETPQDSVMLPRCIRLHAHRLRTLVLRFPYPLFTPPLDFLSRLLSMSTTSTRTDSRQLVLENLRLETTGHICLDLLSLPSLKKLELYGPINLLEVHALWQNLKTLDISRRRLNLSNVLKVLKQASELVECKITFTWSSNPRTDSPIPVIHHNLTRLEIEQYFDDSEPFFHNLILPRLDFLRVTHNVFNEHKMNAFASFLIGSTSLRELILDRLSGLENGMLINFLRIVPAIKVLRLSSIYPSSSGAWPVCEEFLQALTGPEPLLPHLEKIELEGACSFSWASVCDLIRLRLQSPNWRHTYHASHRYHTMQSFQMKIHDPSSEIKQQATSENAPVYLQRALEMGLSVKLTEVALTSEMDISQGTTS